MLRSTAADGSARFDVKGPLGTGSYGAVYEAVDRRSGQHVAIKELNEVSAAGIARFKQEFRALANCHHANLVGLRELIEDQGRWLIVMELVPGEDFLGYVRRSANDNGPSWDEGRLRRALHGMAQGLAALHGYGILHRDLKPSNVRVTPEGRAVLLDFGLVTRIDPTEQSTDMMVGTVSYMAPEQARQRNIGPPADWYAYGVCLFEALTGQKPFMGDTAFEVLSNKSQLDAPRASSRARDVPPDLDELCARLLAREPAERPSASEVLSALNERRSSPELPSLSVSAPPVATPFAGRDGELLQLTRALARTHESELRIVLVEGESGVGKSELVAEFLRRTRVDKPELVALHGRCYENEQVSYKAFDGCIDDLSRVLRALPESECAAMLPPRAAVLGQLFPVLRGVPAVSKAPRENLSADPTARRLEAFDALAALLRKLAEERPVVLVVDDLQWADSESFRLLQALVEHDEPPPVLVVATIRPRDELEADVLAQVEAVRAFAQTGVIQVLGLPPTQAEALAAKLLGSRVPAEWLSVIARESEGHPLFLGELVQFTRSHDFSARGAVTLEAALRARIERLDRRARELLEIVALAARPYGSHIFARALGVASVEEPARVLLGAKLLRLRRGQELGTYHDRIRHASVALIARARLAPLHQRLASALASDPHTDPTEQARHWDLSGEPDRAIDAYLRAAQGAFDTLAFVRASQLCARAMQLFVDESDARYAALLVLRADALRYAGLNAESAILYQRAADRAEGAAPRLRLRTRVAQQLMLSSEVERGLALARTLLREVGVTVPTSTLGTLWRIAREQLWLVLNTKRFKIRQSTAPSAAVLLSYEIVDQLITAVSIVHPPAFIMLVVHQIRQTMRYGTIQGATQAHTMLGWFRAAGGALGEALPLMEEGRKRAEAYGDGYLIGRQAYVEGSARLSGGDWVGGIPCLERAHKHAVVHTRASDDLTNIRYHLGSAWYTVGEYARLARETELWLAEARERRDRRGLALLLGMGHGYIRRLMQDAPDLAVSELEDAVASMPAAPFSFVHFGYVAGMTVSLIGRGGPDALRWLDERREEHRRPLLLRMSMGQRMLHVVESLALLAACGSAEPLERAALVRRARRVCKWLKRDRAPFGRAYGQLALAQIEMLEGNRARALDAARAARELSLSIGIGIERTARFLIALFEDGHAQGPRALEAVEELRAQGWRNPLRALAITAPALPLLRPRDEQRATQAKKLLLDRYELLGSLGGGGFGSVVEACDVPTGRRVALKELVSKAGRSLERFKQEFRALQDVHHENLVRLEALFEHERSWYIAMELVEGEELLSYVRAGGVLDQARLRAALTGIAEALAALHAAGFVHRDVGPDNVRVTREGRAVLLDFGLIARVGDPREQAPVGTTAYAAPEQLVGTVPDPSADVYALGCCLLEALLGRSPFSAETPSQLLALKQRAPTLPSALAVTPLGALALRMLAPDPATRPTLDAVLDALAGPRAVGATFSLDADDDTRARFAGRERELELLDDAFERTCDDGLVLALVEGESGLGKTALVSEFSQRRAASFPGLLVLRARCYENEQVALKAFDGAVDELARALRQLPSPECEALLPKRAALLAQLFPVLTTVPAVAQAPRKGLPADPAAQKLAALECFVQLLERLGRRSELLFVIDDLQWADAESLRLLGKLLERRKTLPFLIVATVRAESELSPWLREQLATLRTHAGTLEVALGALAEGAVASLARELCGDALTDQRLAHLVRESKGHPLFLRELVEQERAGGAATGVATLDQALAARIARFDAEARQLLALVALAAKPYGSHVLARALERPVLPREALIALIGRGLLRRSGSDALSCYHDRIRHVALAQLDDGARAVLAGRLAAALDPMVAADAAERARLWEEAGDPTRAIQAYEQAGTHATETLAFNHAEAHYARALALLGDARDERWHRVLVQHGHALVRTGRSADAARTFELAARHAEGEAQVALRILAAQNLIQSAQVEEGLRATHALLRELGVPVPRSAGAAIARLAWDRGTLALRGVEVRENPEPPSLHTRMQLEAGWSLALPLAWLDPLGSAAVSTRHLRIALASGEPSHVMRALAEEAFARAVQNPNDPQIDRLLERARALGETRRDPALEAVLSFREGNVATYRWQITRASERLEHALSIVTERCPEEAWLRTNIRTALGTVWMNTGEHARLSSAMDAWIAEARDRGDAFALTMLSGLGLGVVRHLMRDDPDAAEAEIARGHAQWPREPFSFAQMGEMVGVAHYTLYRGGDEALVWFDRELPRLSRAFLLRTELGRGFLLFFHACAMVMAYRGATPARRVELLRRAHAIGPKLARSRMRYVRDAMGGSLQMALSALEGKTQPAIVAAQKVQREAEDFLTRTGARYIEGALVGGTRGRALRDECLAAYAKQGWKRPRQAIAMWAAVLDTIEGD